MAEMGVPVRWLTGRHELGLTVLAGKDALDRRITWAHSIDLADPVPWLDGGELLLTTGLRLPRSAADRRAYVERLVTAGITALGFGVGLSFERVPDVLVDTADRHGLPLLEVPLPTPFVAITKAVSGRLAELEYEDTARAARSQLAMTRAALRGGPAAVVRELAAVTGGGVALFGPRGPEPVAAHGLRPGHDTRIAEVLAASPADGTASVGPDGSVAGQVVRAGRRVHGRLVLVTDTATTAADRLLLGHAVSLIALDRERPRDELNRLGGTLAGLLFDGVLDAETAGLSTSDSLAVLAVLDAPPRQVFDAAERVLSGFPLLATVREDCAVVVVPSDVAVRTRGHAGVSSVCAPAGLPSALRQAVTAARVARSRDVPLVRFDALAGRVLSSAPETRAVLAGLAESRLAPLAGTDLAATLLAFLEHNGHTEAASAALGVHRHTLRGRMDRIRALLDVDLDDAHVRAELLLALMASPPPRI